MQKRDIVCWKVCIKCKNDKKVEAWVQNYVYTLGEENPFVELITEAEMFFSNGIWHETDRVYIYKGYYSFAKKSDAINAKVVWDGGISISSIYCVCRCIIPKGTPYYKNKDNGVIISSNIIIQKIIN